MSVKSLIATALLVPIALVSASNDTQPTVGSGPDLMAFPAEFDLSADCIAVPSDYQIHRAAAPGLTLEKVVFGGDADWNTACFNQSISGRPSVLGIQAPNGDTVLTCVLSAYNRGYGGTLHTDWTIEPDKPLISVRRILDGSKDLNQTELKSDSDSIIAANKRFEQGLGFTVCANAECDSAITCPRWPYLDLDTVSRISDFVDKLRAERGGSYDSSLASRAEDTKRGGSQGKHAGDVGGDSLHNEL